jgi:hypothetical protein
MSNARPVHPDWVDDCPDVSTKVLPLQPLITGSININHQSFPVPMDDIKIEEISQGTLLAPTSVHGPSG